VRRECDGSRNVNEEMKIATSDWIMAGPGSLFSFPFVSRALLYRLFDDNISVLICQDPNWMRSETYVDIRGESWNFTMKNNDTKAFAYLGPTAFSGINDLVKQPGIEFALPATDRRVFEFPRVSITLEPCLLHPDGLIASFAQEEHCEVRIEDSHYSVESHITLKRVGGFAPANLEAVPYSRIAIVSKDVNAEYGINSNLRWSLSASGFVDDNIWPPKFTMHLRRRK